MMRINSLKPENKAILSLSESTIAGSSNPYQNSKVSKFSTIGIYPKPTNSLTYRGNPANTHQKITEITLDETKIKELVKTAIFELMQEKKEIFSELFAEIIEDIGMENAIKEGEDTEIVSYEEILKILHRQ